MNRADHHAKAEQLLEKARTTPDQISRSEILAEAQVHATLALSAATRTSPPGPGQAQTGSTARPRGRVRACRGCIDPGARSGPPAPGATDTPPDATTPPPRSHPGTRHAARNPPMRGGARRGDSSTPIRKTPRPGGDAEESTTGTGTRPRPRNPARLGSHPRGAIPTTRTPATRNRVPDAGTATTPETASAAGPLHRLRRRTPGPRPRTGATKAPHAPSAGAPTDPAPGIGGREDGMRSAAPSPTLAATVISRHTRKQPEEAARDGKDKVTPEVVQDARRRDRPGCGHDRRPGGGPSGSGPFADGAILAALYKQAGNENNPAGRGGMTTLSDLLATPGTAQVIYQTAPDTPRISSGQPRSAPSTPRSSAP